MGNVFMSIHAIGVAYTGSFGLAMIFWIHASMRGLALAQIKGDIKGKVLSPKQIVR
jgi:hypothetical protein